MSHLLELLGRGLGSSIGELLTRHFWAPPKLAMEALRRQCIQDPSKSEPHFHLGLAYLRESRLDEAIDSLSLACRRKPDFVPARLALASALADRGEMDRAVEQLKIVNQTNPGEAEILFAIGFCCERLRHPEEAAEYYRDAIARDDSLAAARERLAAVDVLLDRHDEAIEQYHALLKDRPEETWLHTALAHLYYRDGKFSRAVQEFETAIAMEPANWSLVDDEIEALVADGQLREAIERLTQLIAEQGPFADLHLRLGDLYSQIGDDAQAMRQFAAARELQPNYLEAAVKLGTHHMVFGRWDQAAEAFCEAAEINDALLINYVGMGVAYARDGNQGEALRSFDLAAAIEPNSSLLLAEMARLQLKAAVADEFAKSFEKDEELPKIQLELDNAHLLSRQVEMHAQEVQTHPGHADLRYRYGILLRAEGKLTEAAEQFAKAVEIAPSYVQAMIKLGITQQELGKIDGAVATFQQALDLRPEYVDLHYRLGLLYTDRHEFAQAVQEMEAAASGAADNTQVRAGLALSLQNMGLMDSAAALWRSLAKMNREHLTKRGTRE